MMVNKIKKFIKLTKVKRPPFVFNKALMRIKNKMRKSYNKLCLKFLRIFKSKNGLVIKKGKDVIYLGREKMILEKIKQICVVGDAGFLRNSELGKAIDKQQYVARINFGLPDLNYSLIKDIGLRTDIYINRKMLFEKMIPEIIKKRGIKYIFSLLEENQIKFAKENGIELYELSCDKKILSSVGIEGEYPAQKLSTGLAFLCLCLKYKIPEINICGFSTNENYKPNDIMSLTGYERLTNREMDESSKHDFKTERNIKSRLIREGRIKYLA